MPKYQKNNKTYGRLLRPKQKNKLKLFFVLLFPCFIVSLSLGSTPALAQITSQETIQNFQSEITVNVDGSLIVQETITVNALGQEINRGIYRDFPTSYKDNLGNKYKVGFEILEIFRDGDRINYWTESLSNGIRIYMGDKNI